MMRVSLEGVVQMRFADAMRVGWLFCSGSS
jgi:hypothetical protein